MIRELVAKWDIVWRLMLGLYLRLWLWMRMRLWLGHCWWWRWRHWWHHGRRRTAAVTGRTVRRTILRAVGRIVPWMMASRWVAARGHLELGWKVELRQRRRRRHDDHREPNRLATVAQACHQSLKGRLGLQRHLRITCTDSNYNKVIESRKELYWELKHWWCTSKRHKIHNCVILCTLCGVRDFHRNSTHRFVSEVGRSQPKH